MPSKMSFFLFFIRLEELQEIIIYLFILINLATKKHKGKRFGVIWCYVLAHVFLQGSRLLMSNNTTLSNALLGSNIA